MKHFLTELFYRLSLDTPKFFLKVRTICILITLICTTCIEQGIDLSLLGFDVPKILAVVSVTSTVVTFLAVKNTEELEDKVGKKV